MTLHYSTPYDVLSLNVGHVCRLLQLQLGHIVQKTQHCQVSAVGLTFWLPIAFLQAS